MNRIVAAQNAVCTLCSCYAASLADRDLSRQCRGTLPYWNDDTFCLGERVQCIPKATIQLRRHQIRHLDRRQWSVESNRIEHLVVNYKAWVLEWNCKLPRRISMDSYDHIYRKCPHPAIADPRARLLEGVIKTSSTLARNKALQLPSSSCITKQINTTLRYRRPESSPSISSMPHRPNSSSQISCAPQFVMWTHPSSV